MRWMFLFDRSGDLLSYSTRLDFGVVGRNNRSITFITRCGGRKCELYCRLGAGMYSSLGRQRYHWVMFLDALGS